MNINKNNKTNRTNKSINNLKTAWKQLDNACGELDNAFYTLNQMVDLPSDFQSDLEVVDFTLIVGLKNKIEEMLEEKEGGKWYETVENH